ncbi:monothiol glutaredoxin-mitochondrial precursor [Niveomyces insectorum RCEF 264]|uniref:Monothiol glutaredoxin-mitochondrial n=1 Tax=Niveomyces insectorum RCEF 264 TaxID=1081102 RepID=A0A162J267_9HYPO|nr:monothiol glutaredoxin-mitochondrial precursor [Niveomyces insectorum RCEF 264]
MSALREIKSLDEWHAHLAALAPSTLLVVSFHAPWAAPCAQMATVLEALAAEYPADGRTSWVSVNAEELSDVSEQYDVTAVPFLVLLRGGQVVDTVSGSSAVKVRAAIEAAAAAATSSTAATPANGAAATTNGASTAAAPPATAAAAATTTTTTTSDTDLNTRLAALVRAAPVMLFMKGTPSAPQCGFSRQLVALLRERGVKYGFFNILADDEVRQGLKTFADWPTYPQLWVDGELVGGLDIVKEELASDADFFGAYSVQPQQQQQQTAAEGHSNAATATAV